LTIYDVVVQRPLSAASRLAPFRNEKERQLWFAYQAALTALAGCQGRHQDYETHGGQAPRCDLHDLEAQKEALWERLPDHLKDP
jgi:hypothetical protein